MGRDPLILPSALRHGVTHDDIRHAFNNVVWVWDLDEGLMIFVGPDRTARLVELGVVDSDDGPVVVHAMPARPKFVRS